MTNFSEKSTESNIFTSNYRVVNNPSFLVGGYQLTIHNSVKELNFEHDDQSAKKKFCGCMMESSS